MADLSPRELIAEGLAGALTPEQVKTLVDEVLAISKRVRGWCPECKKQVWVEIPDAKAVASSLKDLLSEGFGRAPAADGREDERIVFERVVYMEEPS